MAKIIDYPRASLRNCLDLAKAIEELGGKSSAEMAAHKLGKKVSGAFHALSGAASKFGLIDNKRGELSTTEAYKNYKLAYTDVERTVILREIFLTPPLFEKVAQRFSGQKLPVDFFDKLLIKEFHVQDSYASRVGNYFIEGAKLVDILSPENIVSYSGASSDIGDDGPPESEQDTDDSNKTMSHGMARIDEPVLGVASTGEYTVKISGPGINSTIAITEEDDLIIVEAMLKKVKNKLAEMLADTD